MLPPAALADLAELDLGDAVEREEALEGELVDRQRRGQDTGPRVGDVQALKDALNAAVLAEGPVQGREGDVAAQQAVPSSQLDLGAVNRPSAVMRDEHVDHLMTGVA